LGKISLYPLASTSDFALINWGSKLQDIRGLQIIDLMDIKTCGAFKSEHTPSLLLIDFFEFKLVVREVVSGYIHIDW